MQRKRLLWQFYPPYLLIVLFSLIAVTWYALSSFQQFYVEHAFSDLEARARLISLQFHPHLLNQDTEAIDQLCKTLGEFSETRITVYSSTGQFLGDSEKTLSLSSNASDRPEVQQALQGKLGIATRNSLALNQEMLFLAIPVIRDNQLIGVLRTSIGLTPFDEILESIRNKMIVGCFVILILATYVSFIVSRRISRSLEEMKRGAERFARGELDQKLLIPNSEEMGALAEMLNHMASQLDERLHTVVQQRNEQEAILASMVESVIAVDDRQIVLNINQAAARLFGTSVQAACGRSLKEIVRNVDLQLFIKKTLSNKEAVEGDILMQSEQERVLQAHGTYLRDGTGRRIGALIVLNDITRLRQLENIRRDFVANVSHELRTPITSVKGAVETLLDGAMDRREDALRFLAIISRHADRLNAIIEDLLQLSRVEEGTNNESIVLELSPLKEVLEHAAQTCEIKAQEKAIAIQIECEERFVAKINPPLIEQAIVNLIENAIKYSESNTQVWVKVTEIESDTIIRVMDEGCGIDKRHQPRLFERFYRVDKARSRQLGGTGLGLAIVKHITQAHGGWISVESTVGKGSTFSIHLPRYQTALQVEPDYERPSAVPKYSSSPAYKP